MNKKRLPETVEQYVIETYGCQMNFAESNAIELGLAGVGIRSTENVDEAQGVIINTCSVRKSAENRIWGRLGYFAAIKKKRPFVIIVTGCMAERLLEELKDDAPAVDFVVGTNDKMEIVDIMQRPREFSVVRNGSYDFRKTYYSEGSCSSYVPILNGCNNFCSYCIVPYVRGREVSRRFEDVIAEVRFLDSRNVREITLLGQNVNSYNYVDENGRRYTFPELLKACCDECHNIQWVRFESPHPKDFSDELIEVIRTEPKVAKHLHIPMQSGNTRVLHDMNRRYTAEHFRNLVQKIADRVPGVTFSTDVMVGFPGETEEAFNDTLEMMQFMCCSEAFMYYWNPREGTPAVKFDGQVPDEEKKRRLQILIDMQQQIFVQMKNRMAHGEHLVYVTQVSRDDENQYLARGEHNEMVAFTPKGKHHEGELVNVRYDSVKGITIVGQEV